MSPPLAWRLRGESPLHVATGSPAGCRRHWHCVSGPSFSNFARDPKSRAESLGRTGIRHRIPGLPYATRRSRSHTSRTARRSRGSPEPGDRSPSRLLVLAQAGRNASQCDTIHWDSSRGIPSRGTTSPCATTARTCSPRPMDNGRPWRAGCCKFGRKVDALAANCNGIPRDRGRPRRRSLSLNPKGHADTGSDTDAEEDGRVTDMEYR